MGRKILVDIDNTLTTPDVVIKKMAEMFGSNFITSDELKSYRMGDAFGVTRQQEKLFWDLFGYESIGNSEINIKTTKTIYDSIIKKDDEIHIITARPQSYEGITKQWLEQHNIKYDNLILVGRNSKIGLIEQLKIEVVIDDKPDLFNEIEVVKQLFPKSNTATLINENLFHRYVVDYPYNENVTSEFRICRKTGEIKEGYYGN